MSKDQIKKIEIPVETVDKWYRGLDYIYSAMKFWRLEDKFPTNLMFDIVDEILFSIIDLKSKDEIAKELIKQHTTNKKQSYKCCFSSAKSSTLTVKSDTTQAKSGI